MTENDLHDVAEEDKGECTNFVTLRNHMRNRIRSKMVRATDAATVLAGDFNYVVDEADRRSLVDMRASRKHNKGEEDHWQKRIARPYGLADMLQEAMTHSSTRLQARLDRVYTNFSVIDHLDKDLRVVALPWKLGLSAHRPVSFRRSSIARRSVWTFTRRAETPRLLATSTSGVFGTG